MAINTFQPLADLASGRGTYANGITADGSVIVGYTYDSNGAQHATRWVQGVPAILFPGGFGFDLISIAQGVSADGLSACGLHAPTLIEQKAFIWSVSGGEQQFATRSAVAALNGDGSIGAGYVVHGRGEPRRAAIWASGSQNFIDSPGTIVTSDARAISHDGSIVVGQAVFNSSLVRAFRWTSAGGMQNIGSPDFNDFNSHADGITPDGSVIVGAMGGSNSLHPARWTAAAGWQYLAAPIGITGGTAYAVSADGDTIVGTFEGRAFIWHSSSGMQDLKTVLGAAVPADWTLTEARAITPDGRTLIGNGTRSGGIGGAWIATLQPCTADFNRDGIADFFDYLDFVDAFTLELPNADVNKDGTIDFFDYLDFVDAFTLGC
jgi:hypothetical protein